MPLPSLRITLLALLLPVAAFSQTPAPAIQVSPKAAYDDAMHPLEVTRHSIANWSDIELAAMVIAVKHGSEECAARDPKAFSGDDLADLVRLCALGQEWPSVIDAASRYIAATDTPKPRLSEAYAALIDAQLRVKLEPAAFASSKEMLATVPYDALAADAINEALGYMQFNFTADALVVAAARQPLLLARLQALAAPPTPPATPPPASEPPQSIHELYDDGLALATLQQLVRKPADQAAATLAELDAALPATLSPDDALPIAALRHRYAMLGQPLPKLTPAAWPGAQHYLSGNLGGNGRLPQIPAPRSITALLLFPDWCAQCIRMGSKFPETVFSVAGHSAYLYGLLAETAAPAKPSEKTPEKAAFTADNAANLMAGTPTLAVDPSLLDLFDVTDPPFLILTDANGIIRVAQPVTEDAVAPGNAVDSAIALIGNQWPVAVPIPEKPKSPPVPASPHP